MNCGRKRSSAHKLDVFWFEMLCFYRRFSVIFNLEFFISFPLHHWSIMFLHFWQIACGIVNCSITHKYDNWRCWGTTCAQNLGCVYSCVSRSNIWCDVENRKFSTSFWNKKLFDIMMKWVQLANSMYKFLAKFTILIRTWKWKRCLVRSGKVQLLVSPIRKLVSFSKSVAGFFFCCFSFQPGTSIFQFSLP